MKRVNIAASLEAFAKAGVSFTGHCAKHCLPIQRLRIVEWAAQVNVAVVLHA